MCACLLSAQDCTQSHKKTLKGTGDRLKDGKDDFHCMTFTLQILLYTDMTFKKNKNPQILYKGETIKNLGK